MKNLHPSFIKSQYIIHSDRYNLLVSNYNNGSNAMKMYLSPKLKKAEKTYLKWKKLIELLP
jgi:hypothetical protein